MRTISNFVNFPGHPETPLGTLGDPKNSLKIDFLLKNGVPNVIFRRFLCIKLVFTLLTRFFVDFSRKIDEKSMKKKMCFFRIVACFFQHGDPHETLYFTIRKLLFHFSCFCVFSKKTSKKRSKIETTFFPSEITQKSSLGTRFGTQNGPELTSERSKNRKMVEKNRFWTE